MCTMRGNDISPRQQNTSEDVDSYRWNGAHGTNRKEDSPVRMARRVVEVMLMGCNGVFKGADL